MRGRPAATEYAPFYAGYVSLVPEEDVRSALSRQIAELGEVAAAIGPEREGFAYAPGKWTVRQLLGHVTDAERVFGYRAFAFSRGERQPLPGFDENEYVAAARFAEVPLVELAREFALLREANVATLQQVPEEAWANVGTASGHPVSVRALAFMMVGHVRHHLRILNERYRTPA
jgi:DinB superfamily